MPQPGRRAGQTVGGKLSKRLACRSAPAVGVDGRGGCGDGVERRLGIDPQAAQPGVAAFGHQYRERDSGLGQVCQPRVPQLVQRGAAACRLENFRRPGDVRGRLSRWTMRPR